MKRIILSILILALAAALVGFSGWAGTASGIAKNICYIFVMAIIVIFTISRFKGSRAKRNTDNDFFL